MRRTIQHPFSVSSTSSLRRFVVTAALVAMAATIAVGCGGDRSGDGDGTSGIVGDDGPMSWLPADTWVVASGNLDADALGTAAKTLKRLPVWALAEGFLPASDGAGLRRAMLRELASSMNDETKGAKLTGAKLERAFGDHVGVAIFGDVAGLDASEDSPPVAVWVELDDRAAARDVVDELADGSVKTHSSKGVDYLTDSSGDGAIVLTDDLLLAAADVSGIKQLIAAHEGGPSAADDETGRAVIEASIGDALLGGAVATDPLIEAAPDMLDAATEGESVKHQGYADVAATAIDAAEPLIPDWIGGSLTIDAVGVRSRAAWSNPHRLASPTPTSRELVERFPEDVATAQAYVSDGTQLQRAQRVWSRVQQQHDLDLGQLVANCDKPVRALCALGVELARTALEDTELADAQAAAGDTVGGLLVDMASSLGALGSLSDPAAPAAKPAAAPKQRVFEAAMSDTDLDWTPPASLVTAARTAGLVVTARGVDDSTTYTIRVVPRSPLGQAFAAMPAAERTAAFGAYGIDPAQLTGRGVTLTQQVVAGLAVIGVPDAAPSRLARSLAGDAGTLGESEQYRATVRAVDPPEEVGMYSYLDLASYVHDVLAALGADVPSVRQITPTVDNNLSDIPGILQWSTRETVRDREVGVYELVMPITD